MMKYYDQTRRMWVVYPLKEEKMEYSPTRGLDKKIVRREKFHCDGTKWECPNGCWEGIDHDIPDEFWVTEDTYESFFWRPICPVCREDLSPID